MIRKTVNLIHKKKQYGTWKHTWECPSTSTNDKISIWSKALPCSCRWQRGALRRIALFPGKWWPQKQELDSHRSLSLTESGLSRSSDSQPSCGVGRGKGGGGAIPHFCLVRLRCFGNLSICPFTWQNFKSHVRVIHYLTSSFTSNIFLYFIRQFRSQGFFQL